VNKEEHVHNWGNWGSWQYAGYETEMRTRTCGDHADAEYRQHVHHWMKTADVFAPMGSGLTVEVCTGPTGCGDTKRGK
jgi:hypothetical protein